MNATNACACVCGFVLAVAAGVQAEYRGMWVGHRLDRAVTSITHYDWAAGGNCVIWVERDSGTVRAYDTYTHAWHICDTTLQPAMYGDIARAGADAALVWDSSTIVAFNARTASFHVQACEGRRKDGTYSDGAYGTTAWFLTTEKLYVFDAQDDVWKEFAYTAPDGDSACTVWRSADKADYLFFELRSSLNLSHHTLLAYSRVTGTFDELVIDEDLPHTILQKGIAFSYTDHAGDEDYIGGYSAVSGRFVVQHTGVSPGTYTSNNMVEEQLVYCFFYHTEVAHPEYRAHFYLFNTATGHMDSVVFSYMYGGHTDGCNLAAVIQGRDCIAIGTYEKGGDELLDYRVYDATSRTLQLWETGLLYDENRNGYGAGHGYLSHNDGYVFAGYDVADSTYSDTAMPPPAQGWHHTVTHYASRNYCVMTCDVYQKDTVAVYSYHAPTTQIRTLVSPTTNAFTVLDQTNVFAFVPYLTGGDRPWVHIYTPGTDTWHDITVHGEVRWKYGPDFIALLMDDVQEVTVYDGVTGDTHVMPYGHTHFSRMYCYTYDNFMILDNIDGGSEAYSTFTRSVSSYPHAGNWQGQVAVAIHAGQWDALAYNALYNCFTPLLPDTAQTGRKEGHTAGDSCGAVVWEKGWLYAYDPHIDTSLTVVLPGRDRDAFASTAVFSAGIRTTRTGLHVAYSLPHAAQLRFALFTPDGRLVCPVVQWAASAGSDTKQIFEQRVPSGILIYRMTMYTPGHSPHKSGGYTGTLTGTLVTK
jgi:hypothetical protein